MNSLESEVRGLQSRAEGWDALKLLAWSFGRFQPRVALASSFGAEAGLLIDLAARIEPDLRVFTLDTGFLFDETYALIEEIEQRYGVRVERIQPELTPQQQVERHGEALWSRDPDFCCKLRKVDPLRLKLAGLEAWITGLRREQSPGRATAGKLEWDAKFGLAKLNPLADWTWTQVWEYIRANEVPYNPLRDRNYLSIGCVQCTRPVIPGEDLRAGRWAGFSMTECGLHSR
ncbi:MAG: phosphoadenylyl-sulfate reductase [Acidobacteria bacterium]|nr:phosphoadenylyl-sulfate reductase [Acidobacteriota bacterium]